MRKVEVDLKDILDIISYGTTFGAGAINEDVRGLVEGLVTYEDIEKFISEMGPEYGIEDYNNIREEFKDLMGN